MDFSADAKRRILAAVRWTERQRQAAGDSARELRPADGVGHVARVTSNTAAADGSYPAVITRYSVQSSAWADYGTVRLLPLNDETLYADVRYAALPTGVDDSGTLYLVAMAGCCGGDAPPGTGAGCECIVPYVDQPYSGTGCVTQSGTAGTAGGSGTYYATDNSGLDLQLLGCGYLIMPDFSSPYYVWGVVGVTAAGSWRFVGTLRCNPTGNYRYGGWADSGAFAGTYTVTADCADRCITIELYDNFAVLKETITVGYGCTGAGGSSPISATALGTATSGSGPASSITLSSVAVDSGELLLVAVALFGNVSTLSVTWGSMTLTQDKVQNMPAGATQGRIALFSVPVLIGDTATITATVSGGSASCLVLAAESVAGLTSNTFDESASAAASPSSALNTGATGTTDIADEYVYSAFALLANTFGFTTGTWGGGFASDQNTSASNGGNTFGLTTGDQVANATGTFTGSKSGAATGDWAGLVGTYK